MAKARAVLPLVEVCDTFDGHMMGVEVRRTVCGVCVMGGRGTGTTLHRTTHTLHHRHTVLGYTHSHVQMGRIRVRSHQCFYGFDKTPLRCKYQRRPIVGAALGGGEGRIGDGGG